MPTNKEFGQQLEKRTKSFAVRIIRLSAHFPNNRTADVIRNQVVKSGTSIGANYREANRAVSRADFRHRISICEKEASETQYWLEVSLEAELLTAAQVEPDLKECSELVALFTSIGKNAK
jgi:four helix bundle protein